MTPADLSRTVVRAVRTAVDEGALRVAVPESVKVERSRPGGQGDYATNAALQLAGPAGMPPRAVAETLRQRIAATPGIAAVEITGPGFLNFTLAGDGSAALVRTVLAQGLRYGHGEALAGTDAPLAPADEPRAAAVTETVVRLLRSQGATAAVVPGAPETLRAVPLPIDAQARLGADAARWGMLRPAAHDHPYTGGELLAQRESNPLFRVRYAYSRSRALTRNAHDLGFSGAYEETVDAPTLLTALADHPAVLEAAARHRAPDRLARHLVTTADALLDLCPAVLPLGDEKPSAAHRSRLALAEAAGTVLAGGLSLLGISAPEFI
ncbi:ArgS-related anticodon-binding protein NrtL [Streptomyces sp. NBC_01465]|uniref:ArgS-related anticodon-binding protein NrtL n=1 Tax=Streptomyces sp. NBC_01465 TaxID=2903878 RepID=UPI002E32AB88|nr:DALR anticodon-binding domain-containing protein [Streptomyces sp. NBC_01465]